MNIASIVACVAVVCLTPQDALKKYPVRIDDGKVVVTVPDPFPAGFRRVPTATTHDADADGRTFVIVGGGAAGYTAAQTLRDVSNSAAVTHWLALRCCDAIMSCDVM